MHSLLNEAIGVPDLWIIGEQYLAVIRNCNLFSYIVDLTLSSTTNFIDSSKLKEFADDNLRIDKNGRKFFKRVENTMGKGEMLVASNFSFSHSVFKTLVLQTGKNQGLFGKGLSQTRLCICLKLNQFSRIRAWFRLVAAILSKNTPMSIVENVGKP